MTCRLLLFTGIVGVFSSCRSHKQESAPAPSAAAPVASASAAAKPRGPEGKWQGHYQSERYALELTNKKAEEKAWSEDDGKTKQGKGTLRLVITESGAVSGELSGPLGDLRLSGELVNNRLTARLTSENQQPEELSGVLTANVEEDVIRGTLQASSGDSLLIRQASVELKRAP